MADRALTAQIVAGPGGVMTDEVGVVTGELELRTTGTDEAVALAVRYRGAEEWYTVSGGKARLGDPIAAVHSVAVGLLNRPAG